METASDLPNYPITLNMNSPWCHIIAHMHVTDGNYIKLKHEIHAPPENNLVLRLFTSENLVNPI